MNSARVITAVLALLAAMWVANLLDLYVQVKYNDGGCELLPEVGPGSEDIAVVDDTLALVSAGDLEALFVKPERTAQDGAIFAVHSIGDRIKAEKIRVDGFPKGETFHPHGIAFSNRTQRVYAVSHDCGEHAMEGIEVFELVRETALKLVHERSIRSPSFPLAGLNDVAEGAYLGELYVTQFLSRPREKCAGNERLSDEIGLVIDGLFRRKTKVHRCVWDPENPQKDVSCSVVAEGFKVANGITSDPEKRQFFVVDSVDPVLQVFDRNENGSLSLKDTVKLPYGGDNVEFDAASGKLTLSGNPLLYQSLGRMNGDASIEVCGGMITVEPLQNGSYITEEVLMHNGSKLSMISSAVFLNGKILLGSPLSDGVLVCPIPEQPLSSRMK